MQIREPAVAGAFYPGQPQQLASTVETLLRESPTGRGEGPPPKALIVPHAGYVYSGPVAASAYAALATARGTVERVVLLGPAHRVFIRGLAAPGSDALRTPLGTVPVDRAALASLADLPQVFVYEPAHTFEHSLEVQLPFLQVVLGRFSVVPLVVGQVSDSEVAEVLERLWGGPETLFVVSSDLSHYYPYAEARRRDARTCQAIEALDPSGLDEESACGRAPVRGLLVAARRHGLVPRTLDLRSSGDTAGPQDEVVGYGAWVFSPAPEPTGERSDPPERQEDPYAGLPALARRSIEEGLRTGAPLGVDPSEHPPALRRPAASFVTLRSPNGALRGCMGTFEIDRPLVEGVAENAFRAALRDPRFAPLTPDELPDLEIEVSVLGPREPIEAGSLAEIVASLRPGVDGLVLEDGDRRATFLPSVWEQLPDPDRFVAALWQKAGLPPDHWSACARAWRYTTSSYVEV